MRWLWPLAVILILATSPQLAHAHGAIVAADPAPGTQLGTAPGIVRLRFTEPLNRSLSRALLRDPSGRMHSSVVTGDQEMQIRLSTDAPGVYEVAWTTVSTLDGHTLRGSFRFGVRAMPGPEAEASANLGLQPTDLVVAAARAVEYAALLAAIGMVLLGFLAGRLPPLDWVRYPLPAVLTLAATSGAISIAGEALLASPSLSAAGMWEYLRNGLPAAARLARIGAEVAALGFALARPSLAIFPLAVALVTLAAAGHAAAVRPTWLGIGADALHLAAAGFWAGGILALVTRRPPGGWRGADARTLLGRFSPVAVIAFLVTVGTGALRGAQELTALADLFFSPYGRVLLAKIVGVAAMVPLSILAWRRVVAPHYEAALGISVIVAAALLAAFPLPPARVIEAEEAVERALAMSALPRDEDLTLGGRAGDVLLGLTLRPGAPGRNEALLYLLPTEGESAARSISAAISLQGSRIPLDPCADACRRAELDLRGGERLQIHLEGAATGSAEFELPLLPAREGSDLVRLMQSRMSALHSLRLAETLGPPEPPVRAEFTFQAPDRIAYEVSGSAVVWIGRSRYLRDGHDATWRIEDTGFALEIPKFVWDPPGVDRLLAPRIVGTDRVGDVETQVVSFFAQGGSIPIWFRLWVDAEGLVRRAEMRAEGHFMDHRYSDFDAPLSIEPPDIGP